MQCKDVPGWARAAAATVLLCAASGSAIADTYRITTRAAGDNGLFSLGSMFELPGPEATGPYEWRLTTEFSTPEFEHGGQIAQVVAFDVAMSLELTVGGAHYSTVQDNAIVRLQYFSSFQGGPLYDMRYSVYFTPPQTANHAQLTQSFLIDPMLLAPADLLSPVSLAIPQIASAAFEADSYYQDLDNYLFLGFAHGAATTFSYEVSMVPEPASYAMTLLGCAVVAGAAWRRRAAA
ncbi:PEP-CTERM sorting domain-containing protein [Pseudoduganella lutea]|uniref:PEP-CTERM sorting domain-containing protein n=1 Tax=Pseudoduganella lutea TaxID=321985 RepID=A0A4V0Z403_9BURK|nr:PEP-CTERM sorting domain-containing protein [Pseudoduganella lutea]QBE65243.1 PEP-CTERM sorting domain-containing protein [Pseudoduganella lutea]